VHLRSNAGGPWRGSGTVRGTHIRALFPTAFVPTTNIAPAVVPTTLVATTGSAFVPTTFVTASCPAAIDPRGGAIAHDRSSGLASL
jgi:hypothetical protein